MASRLSDLIRPESTLLHDIDSTVTMMSPSKAHRLPSETHQHVRFKLPPALQTFTCFSQLPIELQDQIWESTVNDPGVHWLRLENQTMDFWGFHGFFAPVLPSPIENDPLSLEKEDGLGAIIKRECQSEAPPLLTKAVLAHPENRLADKSWHLYSNKQMATLSVTSRLAQQNVTRLMKSAHINREQPRRFVMLDTSRDLAFIEYLPPHLYQSDCGLSVLFDVEHLSEIRNVAVRYHPDWHVNTDPTTCCPQCGRFHRTTRTVTPRHLYHFLARSFPKLETVWLIDYMMVQRKKVSECERDCRHDYKPRRGRQRLPSRPHQKRASTLQTTRRDNPRWFRAVDRTFYEATPDAWLIKDRVSRVKEWLQEAYTKYSRLSKYACHKSPETVKFGILGCKHKNVLGNHLDSRPTLVRRTKRRADRDPIVTRKSRRKLSLSSDQGIFSFYFDRPFDEEQLENLPMHYFGSGTLNGFNFEFEMGKLSLND